MERAYWIYSLKNSLSIVVLSVYFISYEINFPVLAGEVCILCFVHPHISYGIVMLIRVQLTLTMTIINCWEFFKIPDCRHPCSTFVLGISNITYKSIIYPTNINTCTYLFTVIMSYLKSIEIILLLIALFIATAPDKRVICISVVFKINRPKEHSVCW